MNDHGEVSIRERVKLPPAATMIESYFKPKIAREFALQFDLEIWIHLAHAAMLARQDIIRRDDARKIVRVLLELCEQGPDALRVDYTLEDLYSYIERHLTATLGPEIGGRLHTGRSRNDLHVTTWRMTLRGLMLDVLQSLVTLRRSVIELAGRYGDTVMPGYTHWQHAQPVTFGYYLLAFADVLQRDFHRCVGAYRHTNRSPLGAGALTTTAFPLDRLYTAEALGFDGLAEIAYDAVASRDDAHEAASAFAVLMTGLSRLAVDLQAWSTLEYRFVELGDQHCAVSSIMPQKKNPACLEHLKASCGMVTGALVASLSASKNTAFADVSDGVTALNEPVTEAAAETARSLRLLEDVLRALTVFPDRMLHMAEIGFGTATELADVIVRETGLSFRMAHNVVAVVVAQAIEAGKPANAIVSADLDAAAETLFKRRLGLSADAVRAALDPAENVRRRIVAGGPAPANMHAMIEARVGDLATDERQIVALAEKVRAARERVVSDAQAEAARA
jgi:argininosuccinate lyase